MTSLGQTVAALRANRATISPARDEGRLREVRGFGSNPGQLALKIHVPAKAARGAPLVIVLHGCTQSARGYASPAGWLDLADRFGFVVVAPEQRQANNPNLCFNWYQVGDVGRRGGEAESIAQMVDYALRTHDLDARRVFVTGLSAGGAMTSVMLATYPDVFAAGAIVAGLPYGVAATFGQAFETMAMTVPPSTADLGAAVRRATDHVGPWPKVSVWHGQSDAIVRPAAGEAVARQWCDVHGAAGPGRLARTPDGRDFLVWMSPAGEPVVELHRIPGLGHGAPVRANGPHGCGHGSRYTPETGLSSTFEIALSWGLAERDARAEEPSSARPGRPWPAEPRPLGGADAVGTVINDALRAAGLLR